MSPASRAALLALSLVACKEGGDGPANAENHPEETVEENGGTTSDGATTGDGTTTGDGATTSGGTTAGATTGTTTGAGTLNVDGEVFRTDLPPDQVMMQMNGAYGSLPDTQAGTVLLDPSYALLADFTCNQATGTPDGINQYDTSYGGKYMHCHLTDEKNQFTARGSFAKVTGYLCSLAKAGKLLLDGQTYALDVAPDASCHSSQIQSHIASGCYKYAKVTVKGVKPAAGSPWTAELDLTIDLGQGPDGNCTPAAYVESNKLFVAASAERLGFKLSLGHSVVGLAFDAAVAMDLGKDGTMRFESRIDQRMTAPNQDHFTTIHARLTAKGTFAEGRGAEFESIDSLGGIFSLADKMKAGMPYVYHAQIHTLKGTTAKGFAANNYIVGTRPLDDASNATYDCDSTMPCDFTTQAKWHALAAACLRSDAGSACDPGITFNVKTQPDAATFKAANAFLMLPDDQASYTAPVDWFDGLTEAAPFTELTTGD